MGSSKIEIRAGSRRGPAMTFAEAVESVRTGIASVVTVVRGDGSPVGRFTATITAWDGTHVGVARVSVAVRSTVTAAETVTAAQVIQLAGALANAANSQPAPAQYAHQPNFPLISIDEYPGNHEPDLLGVALSAPCACANPEHTWHAEVAPGQWRDGNMDLTRADLLT